METDEQNIGTESPIEPQSEPVSAPVESQPEVASTESEPEVVTTTEDVQLEVTEGGSNTTSTEYHTQDGAVVKDDYMVQ